MTSKKQLLFVIDSLTIGGAEKSLVTLLRLIDYSQYDVDLQLFAFGGEFEQFLPPEVNVLPPLEYTGFLALPIWRQLLKPRMLWARLNYSLGIRRGTTYHADKARIYWQSVGKVIPILPKHYDVAIGYAQGIPTFFTIDKVRAKTKLAWVNVDYKLDSNNISFQRSYYAALEKIVVVSSDTYNFFCTNVFPEFKGKTSIVWDICDANLIREMSLLPSPKPIDHSQLVIMTAGRLNKPQKGYDIALATAKELRDRDFSFHWYAVGEGPYRKEMEQYIADNNLQNCFTLLGATANPYSYMRQCDIYVQTSRHEGFGLTIAEARILNRPVVCTNFEACSMQMIDGKNGLVTSFNPHDIADAIIRLAEDKKLYNDIQSFLASEKKGNTEEISTFYSLISENL